MDINVKKSIGAIYFFKNRNYETSDIVLKSSRNNNILNLTNLTNGGKKNNYSYIETKANLNKTINGTIPKFNLNSSKISIEEEKNSSLGMNSINRYNKNLIDEYKSLSQINNKSQKIELKKI